MNTFIDLYEFIQSYDQESIIPWLKKQWAGKDKQESLLRLFGGLGLIDKLKNYHICKGNFNKKTILKHETIKDIFYNQENNPVFLKDKGNSSDLTCISKTNEKHLLVTTSKSLQKEKIGGLDIEKVSYYFKNYPGYKISLCICVRDKNNFEGMIKRTESSNNSLKEHIQQEDTIIIDWNDLNEAFNQFKIFYGQTPINNIIKSDKMTLLLKLHQLLGVLKTSRMKNSGIKKILWGQIQRSGKSYIIAGSIIEDSKDKDKCNYLVITTAPNETIEQQRKVFNCIQLEDFKVTVLKGNNKTKPELSDKNIIICSKQFLQSKTNERNQILWLKQMIFDMRFIDESHNGGTTPLAKKVLDYYGNSSFTVQITATYDKPINDYNIPKDNWILWDLEDIRLCKNIRKPSSRLRLVEKHGVDIENIISKYSYDNIVNEYSKYPELHILTHKIKPSIKNEIILKTQDNNYGWSLESCFLLKQGLVENKKVMGEEFQNEKANLDLWYKIFGKRDELNIPDKEYPNHLVFMERIKELCHTQEINSRYIGEGDFTNEPMIIMAFLPQDNIDKISKATIKLLKEHKVIPDYDIISINTISNKKDDPKKRIEDARVAARNSKNKKGVLVLSGRQCSLGVSIENCDIVLLLNKNTGYDMIYQMMFRCMTEGKNKKCGFVIDPDIHRVIKSSINYAMLIKPHLHPKNAIEYIIREKIINLNADHWMPSFGNADKSITTLSENLYNIYSSNVENAIDDNLNRLIRSKVVFLTEEEKKMFKTMNSDTTSRKTQDQSPLEENIKKGIEKTKIDNSISKQEEEEKQVNYMKILKYLTPLVCILTIDYEESSFTEMFEIIQNNTTLNDFLIKQIQTWWGTNVSEKTLNSIIEVYKKNMKDDKEINQIIRTVKELFRKNLYNTKNFSQLIERFFIPHELEKVNYGEITSPFHLRKDMLDKMPEDFWTSPKKVLEPCCGKGLLLIDIIERFMIGLEDSIPDENERKKIILEQCIYFADINATNIYICKLLIDPCNEYNLNYNIGDTLETDLLEKWNVDSFDGIISNPPYNSSGTIASGNTIWQKFTKLSMELIKSGGYLLSVHPPGWRKPNTEKGKFYGLFDLMTRKNQMLYLSIHNIKDGKQTFKCGTRYDWYLIHKTAKYTLTKVNDEKNNTIEIDMSNFTWLPNSDINTIKRILAKDAEEKCEVIYSRTSYGADNKNRVSEKKNNEFKYPCVHSTPQSGTTYRYSNTNTKGHFGIPKVIFGETGIYNPILDTEGKYGMTHGALAIKFDNEEEGKNIKKAIVTDKFKNFLKSCMYSSYRIDWNIFTNMKKDFWKEFLD